MESNTETFTDPRDGKTYRTVKIGEQVKGDSEKYGTEYKRKSGQSPLAIILAILIVFGILCVAIESPNEKETAAAEAVASEAAEVAARAAEAERDIPKQKKTAKPAKPNPPSSKACKPSFDCKKAFTKVEKMICFGETCKVLASLDKKMAEVYKKAKAYYTGHESEEIQKAQREFVKNRDECGNASCVENMYKTRISFLEEEMK